MGAREEFLANLKIYRAAAQQSALLGASPGATVADESARLLRNGLAVVGLILLEEYLRGRTSEVARYLGSGRQPMNVWPDKLRKLATQQATRVLANHVDGLVREKEDPMPILRRTAKAWAVRDGMPATFPELGFLWTGSNVRSEDVSSLLAAMNVDHPWDQLTDIARRAGFVRIGRMDDVFIDVLRNRHQAAHRFEKDMPLLDVRSFPNSALAFALAFDAIVCRAASQCRGGAVTATAGPAVKSSDVRLRFVDDTGAGWAESLEGQGARLALTSRADRGSAAAVRHATSGEVVVRRDRGLTPIWWRSADLP